MEELLNTPPFLIHQKPALFFSFTQHSTNYKNMNQALNSLCCQYLGAEWLSFTSHMITFFSARICFYTKLTSHSRWICHRPTVSNCFGLTTASTILSWYCLQSFNSSPSHGGRSASEMKATPLPPGSPGTGSSFIPDSVVPSLSFSLPLAAWDLKTHKGQGWEKAR